MCVLYVISWTQRTEKAYERLMPLRLFMLPACINTRAELTEPFPCDDDDKIVPSLPGLPVPPVVRLRYPEADNLQQT